MSVSMNLQNSGNPNALPTDRPPDMKASLSFPKTSCVLWDESPTGSPLFLHLGYYRKPKVCIPEKILRLIQHQCENYSQTHHMLIGSLVVEDDGEGVQFQVERLDTRSRISSDGSGLAPGDLLIPLEVSNNTEKERCGSVEDYHCALRRLQSRCCSNASVDLCEFVLLRGWGSYYSNAHSSVVHLDFDLVTMETVFKATPIPPVPILLTALSKNLAGPMSLSHMQGTAKTGYLSMDHTRKLLLVLESDPKASSLPLVGIWVSGAEFVQHPFVWASCLRYIHNTHLQDRVCVPPNKFLLILYTPLHSRPEFYQCCPTSGTSNLLFQLRSGHEVANMTKALSTPCYSFTEVELDPVDGGKKLELFDAAKAEHGLELYKTDLDGETSSIAEDIEPRCVPTPHTEKVPSVRPMVPDVSVLWTEPSEAFSSPKQQLQYLPSQHHLQQTHFNGFSDSVIENGYLSQAFERSASASASQRSRTPKNACAAAYTPVQNSAASSPVYGSKAPSPFVPYSDFYAGTAMLGTNQECSQASSLNQQTRVSNTPNMQFGKNNSGWSLASPAGQASALVSSHSSLGPTSPAHSPAETGLNMNQSALNPSHQVNSSQNALPSKQFQERYLPQQGHQLISPPTVYTAAGTATQSTTVHTPSGHSRHAAANSLSNPRTTSHLATVAEESPSTSSSSSSSMTPSVPCGRGLMNGQMVSSMSQSLGLNSTQGNATVNNSNASSGTVQSSDDDDSGLSVTPDRASSCPAQQPLPSGNQPQPPSYQGAAATAAIPPSCGVLPAPGASLDSVIWDEVPLAVRTLLEQQNQHLKLLQQQIQMLLHNQSQLSAASANQLQQVSRSQSEQFPQSMAVDQSSLPLSSSSSRQQQHSSHNVTASHDSVEMSSKGVNTTFFEDCSSREQAMASRSVQTSPVRTLGRHNWTLSPVQHECPDSHQAVKGQSGSGSTVSEFHHHSRPLVSSTRCKVPTSSVNTEGGASVREPQSLEEDGEAQEEIIPKDLVSAMEDLPIQERTMTSVASQSIVDMPDFAYSLNDGLALDRSDSPPSVSDCFGPAQDDSYSTVAEDAMDPKQYYSQLMNNIQMFLTNDKNHKTDSSEDHNTTGPGLEMASPVKSGSASSANSSMIPRINYVSMMLGSSLCDSPARGGSPWDLDPGQSVEINAMAMKYLSDDQLTQMAALTHMQRGDVHGKKAAQVLQMVLGNHCSAADVTRLGISPNNMTLGTQNYLQKHGLLGNNDSIVRGEMGGGSSEASAFEPSLRLRTDFSIAHTGLGSDTKDGAGDLCQPLTPVQTPNTNTRNSIQQHDYPRPVKPMADIGASPVLKSLSSRQNVALVNTKSPRQRLARHQPRKESEPMEDPEAEEENILDIARLKQMPKLL